MSLAVISAIIMTVLLIVMLVMGCIHQYCDWSFLCGGNALYAAGGYFSYYIGSANFYRSKLLFSDCDSVFYSGRKYYE